MNEIMIKKIIPLAIGLILILLAISNIFNAPIIKSILFLIGGILCIYGVYSIERDHEKNKRN
jgi:hypothetical protein